MGRRTKKRTSSRMRRGPRRSLSRKLRTGKGIKQRGGAIQDATDAIKSVSNSVSTKFGRMNFQTETEPFYKEGKAHAVRVEWNKLNAKIVDDVRKFNGNLTDKPNEHLTWWVSPRKNARPIMVDEEGEDINTFIENLKEKGDFANGTNDDSQLCLCGPYNNKNKTKISIQKIVYDAMPNSQGTLNPTLQDANNAPPVVDPL